MQARDLSAYCRALPTKQSAPALERSRTDENDAETIRLRSRKVEPASRKFFPSTHLAHLWGVYLILRGLETGSRSSIAGHELHAWDGQPVDLLLNLLHGRPVACSSGAMAILLLLAASLIGARLGDSR